MGSGAITISALFAVSAWMVAPPALNAGALGVVLAVSGGAADAGIPAVIGVPRPGSVAAGADSLVGSLPPAKSARSVRAMRAASAFLR